MYNCKYCNKQRKRLTDLVRHQNRCELNKNNIYGRVIRKESFCENCNNKFVYEERELKNNKIRFCSRCCANSHDCSKESKKTKETNCIDCGKIIQINKRASTKNEKRCKYCDRKLRLKKCLFCNKEFIARRKNQKFCSSECAYNHKKEENLKRLTEYEKYRKDCLFKFNVYKYPEKFNLNLIEKHGWYRSANRGNNQNGISRDHMYSVSEGFKNDINPFLISHPANCCLMFQHKNLNKNKKCTIMIEELKERIKNWQGGSNPTRHVYCGVQ